MYGAFAIFNIYRKIGFAKYIKTAKITPRANNTQGFSASVIGPPKDLNNCQTIIKKSKHQETYCKTVKAFDAFNRFVHLEFFRLTKPKKNLGEVGDFVALEVNMRPAGGYTPDMMNFAHSVDVYQIWADMVTEGRRVIPAPEKEYFCAYASRKDGKQYAHTHEEILERYGSVMKMCERMPEMMVRTMGNQMYTVRLEKEEQVYEFIRFVHQQR